MKNIWCHTCRKGTPLWLDICSINLPNYKTQAFVTHTKGRECFIVLDADGHMLLRWFLQKNGSWNGSGGIVTGYVLDDGAIGDQFFSSPHRLWGQPIILSNRYQEIFHRRYLERDLKLTPQSHLVPRLRMRGTLPPFSHFFVMLCLIKHRHFLPL